MQLLVSVRSAEEAKAALAGGADIIDSKEPSRGSISPVDPETLAAIVECVPADWPLSVALGDVTSDAEADRIVSNVGIPDRTGPTYLKIGFAQLSSSRQVERALRAAVAAARKQEWQPNIIAVAYADALAIGSVSYSEIVRAAANTGCYGVLLDTYAKGGANLLQLGSFERLSSWVAAARCEQLLVALAGGLGIDDVPGAAGLEPDVLGVRAAACEGGRTGTVRAAKVAELHSRIRRFGLLSSFKQPTLRAGSRKA